MAVGNTIRETQHTQQTDGLRTASLMEGVAFYGRVTERPRNPARAGVSWRRTLRWPIL